MHPVRQKKLLKILIPVCVLGCVVGLMMYALRQNISLFYTPTQIKQGEAIHGQKIRMGGRVVSGSVLRQDGLSVRFDLTDMNKQVRVYYQGLLPDLFREEQGIVVEGTLLDSGAFRASTVLAKHDENYMPKEVKAALEAGEAAKKEGAA